MIRIPAENFGFMLLWSCVFFAAVLLIGGLTSLPSFFKRKKLGGAVSVSGSALTWMIVGGTALITVAGIIDTFVKQSNIILFKFPQMFIDDAIEINVSIFSLAFTVIVCAVLFNVFVLSFDNLGKVMGIGLGFSFVIHILLTLLDYVLTLFVINYEILSIISVCIGVALASLLVNKLNDK